MTGILYQANWGTTAAFGTVWKENDKLWFWILVKNDRSQSWRCARCALIVTTWILKCRVSVVDGRMEVGFVSDILLSFRALGNMLIAFSDLTDNRRVTLILFLICYKHKTVKMFITSVWTRLKSHLILQNYQTSQGRSPSWCIHLTRFSLHTIALALPLSPGESGSGITQQCREPWINRGSFHRFLFLKVASLKYLFCPAPRVCVEI